MATLSTVAKHSFKYSSVKESNDTLARTISGLNVRPGADGSLGPNSDVAVSSIINLIGRFSTGTLTNPRWVTEREVVV